MEIVKKSNYQLEGLVRDRESENSSIGARTRSSRVSRKERREGSLNDSIFTDVSENRLSMKKVSKIKRYKGDKEKKKRSNYFIIKEISREVYDDVRKKELIEVKKWGKKFLRIK